MVRRPALQRRRCRLHLQAAPDRAGIDLAKQRHRRVRRRRLPQERGRVGDGKSVVFSFSRVYTPALYDLSQQPIIAEHIWKDVKDPVTFTNDTPVATGPFTNITKFEA